MYVCLCNGYRESELRDLARQGHTNAEDAYEALGDGPCCGQCVDFAQEIMDAERSAPKLATGVVSDFDTKYAERLAEGADNQSAENAANPPLLNDAAA